MTDIAELTPDALRRELAERTGCDINPTDAGAALALCLEIAARHEWELIVIAPSICSAQFVNATGYAVHGAVEDTPALALAQLALATLRAESDA